MNESCQRWIIPLLLQNWIIRWDFKRSGNCLFPWLLMTWHVVHELSIHFCMILKKFSCPFHCHLMSVHLPRRCHFADPSQIANLKTTPLLDKLHIIVKFPIIQLQDADISAVTARAPDIMHFFVIRDRCPPPCCCRPPSRPPRGHVTMSRDLGSGSECWGVWTLAEMATNQQSSVNTHLLKIHPSSE